MMNDDNQKPQRTEHRDPRAVLRDQVLPLLEEIEKNCKRVRDDDIREFTMRYGRKTVSSEGLLADSVVSLTRIVRGIVEAM